MTAWRILALCAALAALLSAVTVWWWGSPASRTVFFVGLLGICLMELILAYRAD